MPDGSPAADPQQRVEHVFQGSAAIESLTYWPQLEQLDVTFTNGQTYTHEGVGEQTVQAFIEAPSPGRFYHAMLKGT